MSASFDLLYLANVHAAKMHNDQSFLIMGAYVDLLYDQAQALCPHTAHATCASARAPVGMLSTNFVSVDAPCLKESHANGKTHEFKDLLRLATRVAVLAATCTYFERSFLHSTDTLTIHTGMLGGGGVPQQ